MVKSYKDKFIHLYLLLIRNTNLCIMRVYFIFADKETMTLSLNM